MQKIGTGSYRVNTRDNKVFNIYNLIFVISYRDNYGE